MCAYCDDAIMKEILGLKSASCFGLKRRASSMHHQVVVQVGEGGRKVS